jgi:kumamolisin
MSKINRNKAVPAVVALVTSTKSAPEGTKIRELAGNKMLQFTLQMSCNTTPAEVAKLQAQVNSGARPHLTDAELVKLFGEKPSHLRRTRSASRRHGLTLLPRSAADVMFGIQRVEGTYAATKAFLPGLVLSHYVDKKGEKFIGREGNITVKKSVPIVGVYGLDTRDIANVNLRFAGKTSKPSAIPSGLTSRGLAKLQGFDMAALDQVADVVTGYISLGGDNGKKMQADAAFAAKQEGIALANIIGVSVDGTPVDGGAAGYADGATVENALDLQAHVLLNPNGHCVAFRADNSDDAFMRANEAAIAYEGVKLPSGKVLKLRACTISWGMAEVNFTGQSLARWAKAAAAARLKGLIITAATGDNGSKDSTAKPVADAPSCVPNIIGAAGIGVRSTDGKTVSSRYVWGDTGGGISEVFPPMAEEAGLGLPVSADTGKPGHLNSLIADVAAPESGPFVRYQNRSSQVGGTSHAAPIIGIKLSKMNKKLEDGGVVISDQITFIYGHLKDGILEMVTEDGTNGDYNAKTTDIINVCVGGGSLSYSGYLAVGAKAQKAA